MKHKDRRTPTVLRVSVSQMNHHHLDPPASLQYNQSQSVAVSSLVQTFTANTSIKSRAKLAIPSRSLRPRAQPVSASQKHISHTILFVKSNIPGILKWLQTVNFFVLDHIFNPLVPCLQCHWNEIVSLKTMWFILNRLSVYLLNFFQVKVRLKVIDDVYKQKLKPNNSN